MQPLMIEEGGAVSKFWVVSNYDYDPSQVIQRLNGPYLLCQQGDPSKVPVELRGKESFCQTLHSGHNLSDYLQFIIDNYGNLPKEVGFIKGNIFPRHIEECVFVERIQANGFMPLYSDSRTHHEERYRLIPVFMVAQQIAPGYYLEITSDWYVSSRPPGRFFPTLRSMFERLTKQPLPKYIPFVPGACMIVPKDRIVRWPVELYKELYQAVTYDFFPVEAYHLERCMLYLFDFPQK